MNTRLCLVLTALLWLLFGLPGVAHADDVTVCCPGTGVCDHADVQSAVDAASEGDTVKIATGVYTDVHGYGGLAQVVYLSKTLTLRGGYTSTNWSVSNPISYPTTLDAQGMGRVLFVTGEISVTLDGLRITGGNVEDTGSALYEHAGGGMFVSTATLTISNCQVFSNSAGLGGGLYLYDSDATLNGNSIFSNTAVAGGGLYLHDSDATLSGNSIFSNTTDLGRRTVRR